jgi:formylglycine-generating enzyme required for sulfatase activity
MSRFNTKLDQARSRQKRVYVAVGLTTVVILTCAVILFVVSRGTLIEIIPEEAKELAEVVVTEGVGFSIGDTVYSFGQSPVITVSSHGYRTATETIDSTRLGKVFPVELPELPGRLVIEVSNSDNDLSGTVWRVNNRDVALSRILDIELKAGSYTIAVDNAFYEMREVETELKRGEETRLLERLQPIEGVLTVSSKPAGALLFLDDTEVGPTPVRLDLAGGRHSLRISAAGHADTVEELEITRDKPEVNRNYQLQRKKARVTVRLMPEGGTLLANGRMVKSPVELDAMVEHRLSYMKAGYSSESQTVMLGPDEEREISFDLQPEVGQVQLESSPPSTVWIGEKDYGMSPVLVSLPAVTHKVFFKKAGYRTAVQSVQPEAGTVQRVSAHLLTEYQARLQEAPREFINQAGIRMKLYVVRDNFTMGAPRSEMGQRANEFQRRISLTKPFYVSMYEITNSQYAKFNPGRSSAVADIPVTTITWQEAAKYCNWLSEKEKLRPFYKIAGGEITGFEGQADGYRLLSEAEWEWLARKSGKTKQTIFSWGDETVIPVQSTNVADESSKGQVRFFVPQYNDGYSGVAPVGSFKSEPSGVHDLAGNVSEWVHDVYTIVPPTPDALLRDPLGQQSGEAHVVKGANWRSGTITTLRPAFREGLAGRRDDVGFRVARYLFGGKNE